MEPAEKFVKRLLMLAVMIPLLIIALVFDEFGGKGWVGLAILVVGAVAASLCHHLWKELRK
jgi:hypothetical protein